jgi:hypothetical protein
MISHVVPTSVSVSQPSPVMPAMPVPTAVTSEAGHNSVVLGFTQVTDSGQWPLSHWYAAVGTSPAGQTESHTKPDTISRVAEGMHSSPVSIGGATVQGRPPSATGTGRNTCRALLIVHGCSPVHRR